MHRHNSKRKYQSGSVVCGYSVRNPDAIVVAAAKSDDESTLVESLGASPIELFL